MGENITESKKRQRGVSVIKIKSSDKLRKIEYLPQEIQRMIVELFKSMESARSPDVKKSVVLVIERKKEMKRLKKLAVKRESAIIGVARGRVLACRMKYLRFTIKIGGAMYGIFYAAPFAD